MRIKFWQFVKEWSVFSFFCILIVAVCLNIVEASSQRKALERVAVETHQALCTFQGDLAQRLEGTEDYLRKHPGPEPIPGVTRATLRRSLQSQRATLEALEGLNC